MDKRKGGYIVDHRPLQAGLRFLQVICPASGGSIPVTARLIGGIVLIEPSNEPLQIFETCVWSRIRVLSSH